MKLTNFTVWSRSVEAPPASWCASWRQEAPQVLIRPGCGGGYVRIQVQCFIGSRGAVYKLLKVGSVESSLTWLKSIEMAAKASGCLFCFLATIFTCLVSWWWVVNKNGRRNLLARNGGILFANELMFRLTWDTDERCLCEIWQDAEPSLQKEPWASRGAADPGCSGSRRCLHCPEDARAGLLAQDPRR